MAINYQRKRDNAHIELIAMQTRQLFMHDSEPVTPASHFPAAIQLETVK